MTSFHILCALLTMGLWWSSWEVSPLESEWELLMTLTSGIKQKWGYVASEVNHKKDTASIPLSILKCLLKGNEPLWYEETKTSPSGRDSWRGILESNEMIGWQPASVALGVSMPLDDDNPQSSSLPTEASDKVEKR